MKALSARVAFGNQIVQLLDHFGLQAGQQSDATGGAFQIQRPSHGQSGAVGLGLQQGIGGCGSTIHRQFPNAMPQGGLSQLHQGGH